MAEEWRRAAGRKGGLRRRRTVTPKRRAAIARQGAEARWKGLSKAERAEAARKAVRARWAKAGVNKNRARNAAGP